MAIHNELKSYAMMLGFPDSPNLAGVFEILYPGDEEVKIVAALPGDAQKLAQKTGIAAERVSELAEAMLNRGAITHPRDKPHYYKRFPAMIELRDATLLYPDLDRRLLKLWDDLLMKEVEPLIPILKKMNINPILRVVPIEKTVESQSRVLDADSARKIFRDADLVSVIPCVCRKITKENGRGQDCPAPDDAVCMQTNAFAEAILRRGVGEKISNEDALRRIALAEEAGLVHMVRNNIKDDMFMCNCCSCCCGALHFIKLGYSQGVAPSRFQAKVDPDLCTACGSCEERCQFNAISMEDTAVINVDQCYGCGNCALACTEEALTLHEIHPLEHIRVK